MSAAGRISRRQINKPTVIIAEFIQTRRAESQLPLPDDLSIIPDRTLNHVAPQTLTLYIKFNIVFFFFFKIVHLHSFSHVELGSVEPELFGPSPGGQCDIASF